jgi:ferredoxin-type protein NapH
MNKHRAKGIAASIILTSGYITFTLFPAYITGAIFKLQNALTATSMALFTGFLFFKMCHTGIIGKYRRVFFTFISLLFSLSFLTNVFLERGHMYATDDAALTSGIPICHIVVPTVLLPTFIKGKVNFPGELSYIIGLIFLLGILLVSYGKSFCSWICFFGGQDEFFSSLRAKPKYGPQWLSTLFRTFPYAFLLFIVLQSLSSMVATYCFYICPLKLTTEFPMINSYMRLGGTFLFVFIYFSLIVFGPYFTKKRTFCSLLCPLGTVLNLTSFISLFKLKVFKSSCINHKGEYKIRCTKCVDVCPTLSITHESISKDKALLDCNQCSICVDHCPTGALDLGIKGVSFSAVNSPLKTDKHGSQGFSKKLIADLVDPGLIFPIAIFSISTIISTPFLDNIVLLVIKYVF